MSYELEVVVASGARGKREVESLEGAELEKVVDADVGKFETFFTSLGNDGLNGYERAAIKTYLHWKTHGEPEKYTVQLKEKLNG